MGLDMYLDRNHYIGAHFEHRNVEATIKIEINGKPIEIDPKKIDTITERVGYWRKANQIHAWFVKNIQSGKDDCGNYDVSYYQLMELQDLCKKVLADKTKALDLLPPQQGFFFGSYEIDEYYIGDLQNTVEIIDALDKDAYYIYHSSW